MLDFVLDDACFEQSLLEFWPVNFDFDSLTQELILSRINGPSTVRKTYGHLLIRTHRTFANFQFTNQFPINLSTFKFCVYDKSRCYKTLIAGLVYNLGIQSKLVIVLIYEQSLSKYL